MKKKLPVVFVTLLILVGVSLLLYPIISNWLTQRNAVTMSEAYVENVNQMTEEEIAEELEKAKVYNDMLSGANIEDPFVPESGTVLPVNYTSVLNFESGMMGYIVIDKIDAVLPIYHGISESVLQKGIGHMDSTAFPIGGAGNHTVLTGHTGLPSAKLFTDLDQLKIGDVFYINVLNQKFTYEVDQIKVIDPDDTQALQPVTGQDYVTLLTCTPYGINSHRLLVRGTRIANEDDEDLSIGSHIKNRIMIMIILLVVLIMILLIVYRIHTSRKGR